MKKILIFISLLILCGCADKFDRNASSRQLIEEGKILMEKSKYKDASQKFEQAVLNSYSPEDAEEAQLLKGDAYYKNKKYIDAIAAYEVYYDLYSSKEMDSVVLKQIALSYYNISSKPSRDQTFTSRALDYITKIKNTDQQYYDMEELEPIRQELVHKLAETDYEIGMYYIRTGSLKSAAGRFASVINNYYTSDITEKAFEKLIEVSFKIEGREALIHDYILELESINPDNKNISKYKEQFNRI